MVQQRKKTTGNYFDNFLGLTWIVVRVTVYVLGRLVELFGNKRWCEIIYKCVESWVHDYGRSLIVKKFIIKNSFGQFLYKGFNLNTRDFIKKILLSVYFIFEVDEDL